MISNPTNESSSTGKKTIGITLALLSAFFIGISFVFKKRGLLQSRDKDKLAASSHAYLKQPLWWVGIITMAVGEALNLMAYSFSPALIVTPLGALSVCVSALGSSIFLKEKLNFSGKIGLIVCVGGSIIICVNAPESNTTSTILEFISFVVSPGFLVFFFLNIGLCLWLAFQAAPRWGSRSPIVYITICSIIGSFLVLSAQGLGAAIVHSISTGDNQFLLWQTYPILVFLLICLGLQVHYLNLALNQFSTAIVTPIYYVFFTTATIVSSAVLFKGFGEGKINPSNAITIVIAFITIVAGVALLFQYSLKVSEMEERKAYNEHVESMVYYSEKGSEENDYNNETTKTATLATSESTESSEMISADIATTKATQTDPLPKASVLIQPAPEHPSLSRLGKISRTASPTQVFTSLPRKMSASYFIHDASPPNPHSLARVSSSLALFTETTTIPPSSSLPTSGISATDLDTYSFSQHASNTSSRARTSRRLSISSDKSYFAFKSYLSKVFNGSEMDDYSEEYDDQNVSDQDMIMPHLESGNSIPQPIKTAAKKKNVVFGHTTRYYERNQSTASLPILYVKTQEMVETDYRSRTSFGPRKPPTHWVKRTDSS